MFKLCITGNLGFEVWQDIPGYKGLYQASTHGRVRNKNGNILKGSLQPKGYLRVNLIGNNKHLIHTLIAETFLPKLSPKYMQVNHALAVV